MRAIDRERGEAMIRTAYMTAALTGAASAGNLEPLAKYLKPQNQLPPPRRSAGDDLLGDDIDL